MTNFFKYSLNLHDLKRHITTKSTTLPDILEFPTADHLNRFVSVIDKNFDWNALNSYIYSIKSNCELEYNLGCLALYMEHRISFQLVDLNDLTNSIQIWFNIYNKDNRVIYKSSKASVQKSNLDAHCQLIDIAAMTYMKDESNILKVYIQNI